MASRRRRLSSVARFSLFSFIDVGASAEPANDTPVRLQCGKAWHTNQRYSPVKPLRIRHSVRYSRLSRRARAHAPGRRQGHRGESSRPSRRPGPALW